MIALQRLSGTSLVISTHMSSSKEQCLGSCRKVRSFETRDLVATAETLLELTALSNPSAQHYAYYDNKSTPSFITALDNLEAYVEAEGPFDGVLAYSQGAGLVAMLLVRRQYLHPDKVPLFRCAILFSPGHVFDPMMYLETGEVRVLEGVPEGKSALSFPVVVIYGEEDELRHGCSQFAALCDPDLLSVFVHEGGHEVPGLGAKSSLLGAVKMARRGIIQAELATVD